MLYDIMKMAYKGWKAFPAEIKGERIGACAEKGKDDYSFKKELAVSLENLIHLQT